MRGPSLLLFCVLPVLTPAGPSASHAFQKPGLAALDYAFRFASAIESDAKDRSQAQESVVLDYLSLGTPEEARRHADLIKAWRQGTAYAGIAEVLARQGHRAEAEELIRRAEAIGREAGGWQGVRVTAHVAQALAALGEVDRTTRIAGRLASDDAQQYSGQAVAAVATGHAARDEFGLAMEVLAKLEGQVDFDVVWWRTEGYLSVARQESLPRLKRDQALRAARRSAEGIAGWKRAEALESVARLRLEAGDPAGARESLDAADRIAIGQPDTMPVKAALLSRLARARASLSDARKAREILAKALAIVPSSPVIDRPGSYAEIASGLLAAGDAAGSGRLYDVAFATAESLTNARPRALAVVAICRSLGRDGQSPSERTRATLERLYQGLGDPW